MTEIITHADRITTLHRTLDWLEANPEKATRGQLARDEDGYACDPHGPEADCFCFIGRLIVEADIRLNETGYGDGVVGWFKPTGARYDRFMGENDRIASKELRFQTLRAMIGNLS